MHIHMHLKIETFNEYPSRTLTNYTYCTWHCPYYFFLIILFHCVFFQCEKGLLTSIGFVTKIYYCNWYMYDNQT